MSRQQADPAPLDAMRIVVGLALQPIVAAAVAFLLFPLLLLDRTGQAFGGGRPVSVSDSAASVAFAVGIVTVPVVIAGVFPTLLWLLRRGAITLTRALSVGLVFGNLPIVIGFLLAGTYGAIATLRTIAYASTIGVAGATTFWLVVSHDHERQA